MHRSMLSMWLALVALLFGSFRISFAQEIGPEAFVCASYSGQIAADTTWSPATCPSGYTITGNVLVQEGITLNILPGTLVKFNANPTLSIAGKLVARGTATQPIIFTSNATTPVSGDWNGIVFNTTSTNATFDSAGNYTGGSILQHVSIEFAGSDSGPAIQLNYASPYLDHVIIRNTTGAGISGVLESEMRLNASTIQNNQGNGIDLKTDYASKSALYVVLTDNLITNNSGSGIKLYNDGPYQSRGAVVVNHNTVQTNNGPGVSVELDYDDTYDVVLNGNTISSNQLTGVYIQGQKNSYIDAVHVQIIGNTITNNTGGNQFPFNGYCVGGLLVGDRYTSVSPVEGQITGNTITNNVGYSGYCSGYTNVGGLAVAGSVTVRGNTITGNTIGGGIDVRGGKPVINNNNIFGNTYTFYSDYPPTPRNVIAGPYTSSDPTFDAKLNWWGTTSIADIEAGIYDYADNTAKNQALYDPFRNAPVSMISGRITNSQGQPVAGVTVSAGENRTAVTDSSGWYFLSGLSAGSYTLTPSRANFVFTPASLNVTITTANIEAQNFTGTQTSYTISGRIVDKDGTPQTDVTVSDGAGHTTATDADGYYQLSGLSNGNYTVTPTRRGYRFTPASRTVAIAGQDGSGQDFVSEIVYYTISGKVLDSNGTPLQYVRIDAGGGRTEHTAADGTYTFKNLQENTYTLTPSYGGYIFTPASRVVIVGPNATGQDFTRFQNIPRTISGRIVDRVGKGLIGVVVSNGQGRTVTTGADGSYRFTNLSPGNYTLTPQLSGYFFAPRARSIMVQTTDLNSIDFAGGTHTGSPGLLVNYTTGRAGSYFTLTGTGYPANNTMAIRISGRQVGTVQTDSFGSFTFILSTSAGAQVGMYQVIVTNCCTVSTADVLLDSITGSPLLPTAASSASIDYRIDPAAPQRPRAGDAASIIDVPSDVVPQFSIYLPLVRK